MKKIILLFSLLIMVFIAGCTLGQDNGGKDRQTGEKEVNSNVGNSQLGSICTKDALVCPNGDVVGREGENCEFVCPTFNSTTN